MCQSHVWCVQELLVMCGRAICILTVCQSYVLWQFARAMCDVCQSHLCWTVRQSCMWCVPELCGMCARATYDVYQKHCSCIKISSVLKFCCMLFEYLFWWIRKEWCYLQVCFIIIIIIILLLFYKILLNLKLFDVLKEIFKWAFSKNVKLMYILYCFVQHLLLFYLKLVNLVSINVDSFIL